MTVCVGVLVYDGIVFAADSATSLVGTTQTGQPSITNVYKHGNKVFNLVRGLPIVAMTCGMANLGAAPIAVLTKDLRREMSQTDSKYYINPEKYSMNEIAEKTRNFFAEIYETLAPKPASPHEFTYWIGGFGSDTTQKEIWSFNIQNGTCFPAQLAAPTDAPGVIWGGQPEAISRLIFGFSPKIKELLNQIGIEQSKVDALVDALRMQTQVALHHAAMPIQDAIDLADFLVDLTKRFVRFMPGADIVGGDTDIAVVTRHERFKWIRRKHYYSPDINRLETDHV